MDGLWWKTLWKWMIWGYHYFWKHPYITHLYPYGYIYIYTIHVYDKRFSSETPKKRKWYFFPLDIFKHFQTCLESRCGLILGKVPLLKLGLLAWPSFEVKVAGHCSMVGYEPSRIFANSERQLSIMRIFLELLLWNSATCECLLNLKAQSWQSKKWSNWTQTIPV